MSQFHTSVLLEESIAYLNITPGMKYIDATLGGGGHTSEILKNGGNVLGIDQDSEALTFVRQNLPDERLTVVQGSFKNIKEIAEKNNFGKVSGILFDLGVSSHQLDIGARGFSFMKDAPLDMRMDRELAVTAADLLNGLTKQELTQLLTKFGEETNAWKIVPAILRAREIKKIETTKELAMLIEHVITRKDTSIHPATKVFQALRIAVNDELNSLKDALNQSVNLLSSHGRLVVIDFHSLEDRIVKNAFLDFEKENDGGILSKKPITPSDEEISKNARSRSAKMRVFEKN